jgi:4-amino-4-deoxy-L-arabinose transferase-like glycosyltransferase
MRSGLAARNGGPIGLIALVVILLLGLGLRVGYAWDGRAPVYDAQAYAKIAANFEQGEGFTAGAGATQPSSNYSPGLPLTVAGVYAVTGGAHERTARVVLALIGALAVLFAYLIGRRLSGVVAGLIGAGAVALYPALLEYQGMLMSEPLAATLLSGAVLAMFWARDARQKGSARGSCPGGGGPAGEVYVLDPPPPRHPRVRWLLPGILLGALALTRPEYLGVAFLLSLVIFGTEARDGWREGLIRAGVLLAGLIVVIAPWTIRNAVALDRFVPISTGGGQVLYAGTYLPSDGDPEKVGPEVVEHHPELFAPDAAQRLRLEQILARLAAARYPGMETDEALSKMGREGLWDDVTEEPLEYLGFVATKVGRIWSHGPRQIMREPVWEVLHWALLVLGFLGLGVLAWQRRWEALVIGTIFLAITLLSALLVASPRRVLVMLPLLAALAGVGAVWLWDQSLKLGFLPYQKRSPSSPAST